MSMLFLFPALIAFTTVMINNIRNLSIVKYDESKIVKGCYKLNFVGELTITFKDSQKVELHGVQMNEMKCLQFRNMPDECSIKYIDNQTAPLILKDCNELLLTYETSILTETVFHYLGLDISISIRDFQSFSLIKNVNTYKHRTVYGVKRWKVYYDARRRAQYSFVTVNGKKIFTEEFIFNLTNVM